MQALQTALGEAMATSSYPSADRLPTRENRNRGNCRSLPADSARSPPSPAPPPCTLAARCEACLVTNYTAEDRRSAARVVMPPTSRHRS